MYLHIGNEINVRVHSIIGIFDMDRTTLSQTTRSFLSKTAKEGKTVSASADLPKAFLLTEDGTVYLSQLSPQTLSGRINRKNNQ